MQLIDFIKPWCLGNFYGIRIFGFPAFKTFFSTYHNNGTTVNSKFCNIGYTFNFGPFNLMFHTPK